MPLQNRVTPFGEIVAVPDRGGWTGNRGGQIHDAQRRLTRRRWASSQWIICRLAFKGRRRALMQPGHYTELFFTDEATALAAGHRPCGECRREDFTRFKTLWFEANAPYLNDPARTVKVMDSYLHAERVEVRTRAQKRWESPLAELPDGVMIALEDGEAYLIHEGRLCRWSFAGYAPGPALAPDAVVSVLTPPSIVRTIRAGYVPQVALEASAR